MKEYPVRMTLGQVVFVTLCLGITGFITFYLGARFGPEVFWDIKLDRLSQESLLPTETSEQELALLLEEESLPEVTFHEELQKKGASLGPLEENKKSIQLVVSPPPGSIEKSQIASVDSVIQTEVKTAPDKTVEKTEKKESTQALAQKTQAKTSPVKVVVKKEEKKKTVEVKKTPEIKKTAKVEPQIKKQTTQKNEAASAPLEAKTVSPVLTQPIEKSGEANPGFNNGVW